MKRMFKDWRKWVLKEYIDDYDSYELKLREIKINKKYEQKDDLIVEINEIYAGILEHEIKKYPEQYFWFHKKWDKKIYK